MTTQEITEPSFAEKTRNGIVLIDWWAPWCGPCRAFAPTYEAAAARHPDVVFGKVNTENEQALASAFEIRAIPTLMAFRDGILVFVRPGMLPASALDELVTKLRALDMNDVRKRIQAAQAAPSTP